MSGEYLMPAVRVGDLVDYYPDANYADPNPALVLAVDEQTVNLSVFVRDSWNSQPVPHARHRSDPSLQKMDVAAGGAWDYLDQHREGLALRETVRHLGVVCSDLRNELAGVKNELAALKDRSKKNS